MTVATMNSKAINPRQEASQPFWHQVTMMTWRNLMVTLRTPAEVIPGIMISIFFLLVFSASLGDAPNFLPGLIGKDYLGFILPVSIVSTALSSSSLAGLAIVRDIENGYFDKLMLTPVSRAALMLGAMFAGAISLGVQTTIVTLVGVLMGLQPATGVLGLLGMIGIALLLGSAFAGFTVGIALRTGSAGATQGASFLFFPLTFLTATFVPLALLTGWIKTAATFNPITYILEATRGLLMDGWQPDILLRGVLVCLALGAVTFWFAMSSLRARTRQR